MHCQFCNSELLDKDRFSTSFKCGTTNYIDAPSTRSNQCFNNQIELLKKANSILSQENDSLSDRLQDHLARKIELEFPKENQSIPDLIRIAHKTALEHGWWNDMRSPLECMALIHSEVSEAVEEIRKPKCAINENWYQADGKPEGVGMELADAVIRIFDFCGYHKINLEGCLIGKMKFNETRPWKHGKLK